MVFKVLVKAVSISMFMIGAFNYSTAQVLAAHPEAVSSKCEASGGFLGFENWYRGLYCEDSGHGPVVFTNLNDTWVVLGNVMLIGLRMAGLLAVVFIIYGGIRYITSQGEPENLQAAKKIITNSIIGLIIAMLAATIVGFVAGQF